MIRTLDFSHEKELTIDELIRRIQVYHTTAPIDLIKKAYTFAEKAHTEQKRSSGEAYIVHPLNVAATLVKLRMDIPSIVSALLHDVMEDCDVGIAEIEQEFNKEIGQIVLGLTNIARIQFRSKEEGQAENFRKLVLAMAKDIRVIIVKLADRLHNMRTLEYVSKVKQTLKAQETLDVYVPLAGRLGIHTLKAELEDLCLRYLKPEVYYRLAEKVAKKKSERERYIEKVKSLIQEHFKQYSIEGDVTGRSKHFYSIYRKMQNREVDFDDIHDLLAFRIIVQNITECYKCLGVLHSAFTPIPGRFKDYIAIPKANNYQSLHTTVIGPDAERIEMQIRTYEMHEVAEKGVAAHWMYKEGTTDPSKLEWVQRLLEFNQDIASSAEFFDTVKGDLDLGEVYVFTPNGDVKALSFGSTVLDFAYAVHSEVGNHCVGVKVNGKIVPLKHKLKSGDTVEVLTNKTQVPSKDWLKIAQTSRARTKIKQWLLQVERDKDHETGQEILEKALKIFSTSMKALEKKGDLRKVYEEYHLKDMEELYVQVGSGKILLKDFFKLIPHLNSEIEGQQKEELKEIDSYGERLKLQSRKSAGKDNAIFVDGAGDIMTRMAKCCNPIPGDPIIGFITKGRGITVHTINCKKKDITGDSTRQIEVLWNPDFSFKHPVNIRVVSHDRPGILAQISKQINGIGVNIRSAIARSLSDKKGSFIFEVEVKDYSELLKTISTVEALEDVISVSRI
ncbi:MAG: bifunctional (p)ppGpp synthetase/guanosine-3',5'-bis(diphosphate) 3'-pyrophosphohydrolase [Bacteriovoracaceae bacterium]|nr:bifunctional (p)ppGpp synthetase/guanosine-3',5'-bis(diphosphate) 3'-pyrophosphohydrolase [Bacteriovoracaceae bacterium]